MPADPLPLTPEEEALYREGLRTAPALNDHLLGMNPRSLTELLTAEWADRCRRLLATLDAARAVPPAPPRETLVDLIRESLEANNVLEYPNPEDRALVSFYGGGGKDIFADAIAADLTRDGVTVAVPPAPPLPPAPDALREALDDVAGRMEMFADARERDVRANRDAPDNINASLVGICRSWASSLRAALRDTAAPAPRVSDLGLATGAYVKNGYPEPEAEDGLSWIVTAIELIVSAAIALFLVAWLGWVGVGLVALALLAVAAVVASLYRGAGS